MRANTITAAIPFSATAATDIPSGATVRVTGVAGAPRDPVMVNNTPLCPVVFDVLPDGRKRNRLVGPGMLLSGAIALTAYARREDAAEAHAELVLDPYRQVGQRQRLQVDPGRAEGGVVVDALDVVVHVLQLREDRVTRDREMVDGSDDEDREEGGEIRRPPGWVPDLPPPSPPE